MARARARARARASLSLTSGHNSWTCAKAAHTTACHSQANGIVERFHQQ